MAGDLRCTCDANTLLAKVARDPETGKPCLHIKAFRHSFRRPLEIMLLTGTARISCRDCGRWFTVSVARERVAFKEVERANDCESDLDASTVAPDRHGNRSRTSASS